MTFFHSIGDKFIDPDRGEILVIDRNGCDGCAYSSSRNYSNVCNASERLRLTGSCLAHERSDRASVQFVKPNDYAVFKLTGEWP